MLRLLFALAVIFTIWYLMARYRRLPSNQRRQWLTKIGVGAFVVIMLLGVATGKMHWLGAVLAAIVGLAKFGMHFIFRALPFLRVLGSSGLGNPVFSTEFLRVQINLQNNSVNGSVIKGPHEGRSLLELSDAELAELEQHYESRDKRSYFLIRVMRQRMAGAQGQQHNHQRDYSSVSDPSYDEALQILGLEDFVGKTPPTRDVVVKAHRRLMQKLHPDHGGNDYLASRVNIAKDVVLKKIPR